MSPIPTRWGIRLTDDGAETDLDLGHMEWGVFIDINLTKYSNVTQVNLTLQFFKKSVAVNI